MDGASTPGERNEYFFIIFRELVQGDCGEGRQHATLEGNFLKHSVSRGPDLQELPTWLHINCYLSVPQGESFGQ